MGPNETIVSFGFVIILGLVLAGIAKLSMRGEAKPVVVLILLLMPLLFLFGIPIVHGEIPEWSITLSGAIIVGIICSIVGGLIVWIITKKK